MFPNKYSGFSQGFSQGQAIMMNIQKMNMLAEERKQAMQQQKITNSLQKLSTLSALSKNAPESYRRKLFQHVLPIAKEIGLDLDPSIYDDSTFNKSMMSMSKIINDYTDKKSDMNVTLKKLQALGPDFYEQGTDRLKQAQDFISKEVDTKTKQVKLAQGETDKQIRQLMGSVHGDTPVYFDPQDKQLMGMSTSAIKEDFEIGNLRTREQEEKSDIRKAIAIAKGTAPFKNQPKPLTPDKIRTRLTQLHSGLTRLKANKGLDPLTIALLGDNPEALKSLQGGDISAATSEFEKQISHYENMLKGKGISGSKTKHDFKVTRKAPPPKGVIRRKVLKTGKSISVVKEAVDQKTKKKLFQTPDGQWVDNQGVIWKLVE